MHFFGVKFDRFGLCKKSHFAILVISPNCQIYLILLLSMDCIQMANNTYWSSYSQGQSQIFWGQFLFNSRHRVATTFQNALEEFSILGH